MPQEQIRKDQSTQTHEEVAEIESTKPTAEQAAGATAVRAELDALLDDIDAVLETNAVAFVKSYVQKGGE